MSQCSQLVLDRWIFIREPVGLLVESISLGKRQQDGRTEVQTTYRFGQPPASEAESVDDLCMPDFKNGSRS